MDPNNLERLGRYLETNLDSLGRMDLLLSPVGRTPQEIREIQDHLVNKGYSVETTTTVDLSDIIDFSARIQSYCLSVRRQGSKQNA